MYSYRIIQIHVAGTEQEHPLPAPGAFDFSKPADVASFTEFIACLQTHLKSVKGLLDSDLEHDQGAGQSKSGKQHRPEDDCKPRVPICARRQSEAR